ncbi:MAG TPA: 30S ribosome-binding factor RbfA [Candidatus Doudnabacteria bacterium]|nr:30S ribosome-binding factor RbfA [Candidatus Doudnabacteria bacterium]
MNQKDSKSSNRIERLNSLFQKLIGEIIQPYLSGQAGLATVSRVEVSRDARWAKVWIGIVGGDDDEIFNVLKKNIYDIQGELNRQVDLKMVPRLQFYLDTSPRYAQHINELIDQLHKEEGGEKK